MPPAMKLLFVSPVPTHPVNAGHRARIWSLIRVSRQLGHDVWFAHIEREKGEPALMREALGDRYAAIPWREPESAKAFRGSIAEPGLRRALWRRGLVAMGLDDWWDPAVEPALRALHEAHRFDAVCVEYVFASRALECFAGAHALLDTHDRFGGRARVLARHGIEPNFFYTTTRREAAGIARARVALAIQGEEARYFRRIAPRGTRVETVSHAVEVARFEHPPRDAPPVVLYVGSDNSANVHGMRWFLTHAWATVRRAVPGARLRLVGSIADRMAEADAASGVDRVGRVADPSEEYRRASVVINPTVFGTGVKIKSLEALGFGLPLVTTPEGARGLALPGEALATRGECGFVVERPPRLAAALIGLLTDPVRVARLRGAATRFAERWNAAQRDALARALAPRGAD